MATTSKRDYVDFWQLNTGVRTKRTGIQVGKYLVITYTTNHNKSKLQIFSILSGRPMTDLKFPDSEEGIQRAIQTAQNLDAVYHDFFDLHLVYPDWDIVNICKWTVPQGIRIYVYLSRLEQLQAEKERKALAVDTITVDDMHRAWEASQLEVPSYERFVRPR